MSRQLLTEEEVEERIAFFKEWAAEKITVSARVGDFGEASRLALLAHQFCSLIEISSVTAHSNQDAEAIRWIGRRVSDCFYAIEDIRRTNSLNATNSSDREEHLIGALEWVREYVQLNFPLGIEKLAESVVEIGHRTLIPPSWSKQGLNELDETL